MTIAYVERLNAHRLTLALPVINAAGQITFLVSGASKRAIVKKLLGAGADASNFPGGKSFTHRRKTHVADHSGRGRGTSRALIVRQKDHHAGRIEVIE